MTPCANPLAFEALTAYWLGELPAAEATRIEEHFFGCAHCARRLEELAACAAGVRAAVHGGAVRLALTPRFLEHMKRAGLRIREYQAAPGDTVNCTLRAEDDAVVSRLKATLAGVTRVDALHSIDVGGKVERWRAEDVPFDEAAGEVLLTPATPALRAMPAHTARVRLVAVEEGGERALGEYAFAHTPG